MQSGMGEGRIMALPRNGYALVLDGSSGTDETALEHDLANAASMHRSPRMHETDLTDAIAGSVHWRPAKSL